MITQMNPKPNRNLKNSLTLYLGFKIWFRPQFDYNYFNSYLMSYNFFAVLLYNILFER